MEIPLYSGRFVLERLPDVAQQPREGAQYFVLVDLKCIKHHRVGLGASSITFRWSLSASNYIVCGWEYHPSLADGLAVQVHWGLMG